MKRKAKFGENFLLALFAILEWVPKGLQYGGLNSITLWLSVALPNMGRFLHAGLLKCTGIVRMQNANIFVKNIHFFSVLIDHIAQELNVGVGEYTHWITNICHDRSATSC